MKTYEVRLESPDSSQFRLHTIGAENESEARKTAEASERELVDFSLLPPEKDVWEAGGHAQAEAADGDAVVDLKRWDAHAPKFHASLVGQSYDDHVKAAKWRLDQLAGCTEFDSNGKARSSLTKFARARYLAHLQSEPFEVSDVREVSQDEQTANDLVRQVRALHENDPSKWAKTLEELREAGVPLAAVTAALYGVPTRNRNDGTTNGQIDWHASTANTFKTSLHTVTYAPAQDTDDFFNDCTNEITGTGYTAGGVTLTSASLTATYDSTSDQARYDGPDAQWTSSTLTARIAVVYKSTGTGTTSPLVGYVDFGADVSTTSGTFTITWDATGVWLLDVT